nr:hypothetical protein BaRGS_013919 [Batillaria attramentaria]
MWKFTTLSVLCLLGAQCILTSGQTSPCGVFPNRPASAISPFIVGGSVVDPPYSWPFMCSIVDNVASSHFSGGFMIKSDSGDFFALTAAHVHENEPFEQQLDVQEFRVHPEFSINTFQNDVAVVKLASQPVENATFMAVCLPSRAHQPGEQGVVLGWGATSEGITVPSEVLREGMKPIVSDSDCTTAYGMDYHPESMMCAGNIGVGGVDSCSLDSGGPMVVQRNGVYEATGIVSWGYGCGRPEFPGVYADVFDLLPWIRAQLF